MPDCATNSACSSRRSSRASAVSASYYMGSSYMSTGSAGGYPGGGFGLPGSNPQSRRSSGGGSRRGSLLVANDSLDSNPGDLGMQMGMASNRERGSISGLTASSFAASASQPPQSGRGLGGDPGGGGPNGTGGQPGNAASSAGASLLQSIGSGVVGAASSLTSITSTPPRYRKTFMRPSNYY